MSAHPHTLHLPPPEKFVPGRYALTTLFPVCALVGAIFSVVGAITDPAQFAYSWFLAFYFFFTIGMGAFFWVTLHYACNSAWTVLVRRVWENMLGLLPLMVVIFLPLLAIPELRDVLWKWMSPNADQHEVEIRNLYLNPTFFYLRVAGYLLYFCIAGLWYRRRSVLQDTDGSPIHSKQMHDYSYISLVIFGLIETFVGFDWYMGLDWRWSSSLFGVYNFGVIAQASMAACIVIVAMFRSAGHLRGLNPEHYYLMGKLLFGFTIFWAYVAFGQYLLIWYGNIPEETIFYNNHNRGHWIWLTWILTVGKFMFPAIYLLAQDTKKSLRALTFIAAWILFMHFVELYWFIMPYAHMETIRPSWQDLVCFVTVASILGYAFIRLSASTSLFPPRDPRLVECLTITN